MKNTRCVRIRRDEARPPGRPATGSERRALAEGIDDEVLASFRRCCCSVFGLRIKEGRRPGSPWHGSCCSRRSAASLTEILSGRPAAAAGLRWCAARRRFGRHVRNVPTIIDTNILINPFVDHSSVRSVGRPLAACTSLYLLPSRDLNQRRKKKKKKETG